MGVRMSLSRPVTDALIKGAVGTDHLRSKEGSAKIWLNSVIFPLDNKDKSKLAHVWPANYSSGCTFLGEVSVDSAADSAAWGTSSRSCRRFNFSSFLAFLALSRSARSKR